MIQIHADSPEDAARIRQAVVGPFRVTEVASDLILDDDRIACLVLGARKRSIREGVEMLRDIRKRMPWLLTILVTDHEAGVARWLSTVQVSGLVWFTDLQADLQPRIEAAFQSGFLAQLAERIGQASCPPALRSALVRSLRRAASQPFRTVAKLAAVADCSPVTLSQQFRVRSGGATSLNRFLGALVILRAAELRLSHGSSWKRVSEELGFAHATLGRKSKVWPGCTLGQLERLALDQLREAFAAEYVYPLLGTTQGPAAYVVTPPLPSNG